MLNKPSSFFFVLFSVNLRQRDEQSQRHVCLSLRWSVTLMTCSEVCCGAGRPSRRRQIAANYYCCYYLSGAFCYQK